MSFWDGKKVLVTGGAGFVGSHVVEELLRRGKKVKVTVADNLGTGRAKNLAGVRHKIRFIKSDLLDLAGAVKACRGQDAVLNLAARVHGVGYNVEHPGTMFRDNMLLGLNLLEAARLRGVGRFLVVSSACVYPRDCSVPTPEVEGFDSTPDAGSEGYGWAKRMAEYMAQAYHREFGMKIAIARPYNAYGPRDHFDSDKAHVIGALVRRCVSGEDPVVVWGDGTHTRDFLYVEDFARGLLDVCERYPHCDPVNIGAGTEVTIRELAGTILRLSGSKAKLRFDRSKPGGQPRRRCDASKARAKAGFRARVGLEEGLRRTIDWYKRNRD